MDKTITNSSRVILLVGLLLTTSITQMSAQTSPAVGEYGSIWINDGDQIGRLDFSSSTSATFTLLATLSFGNFSDFFGEDPVLTDIAWAPDYSTMYGVISTSDPSSRQGLVQFDPNTGVGSIISSTIDIGEVNLTTANGAGFVNGNLYTGADDMLDIFQINTTTGSFTSVGALMAGGVGYYSPGDIVTYNGVAYATGMTVLDGDPGGDNQLLALNMSDLSNSTNLGTLGGSINYSFGLAAIDGVGLYIVDGLTNGLYLVDPSNPANVQLVTIDGDTSSLAGFYGATGAAPVPEPSSALLVLAASLIMGLRRRCR